MKIVFLLALSIFFLSNDAFSQTLLKLNEAPNTHTIEGKKISEYEVADGSQIQLYMGCHEGGKAIKFTEVEYKYFAKLDRRDLENIKVYTVDVAKLKSSNYGTEIMAVGEDDYFGKGDFHKISITCAMSSKAIHQEYLDTYAAESFSGKDTTYMFVYFKTEEEAKRALTSFSLLLSGGSNDSKDCNDFEY